MHWTELALAAAAVLIALPAARWNATATALFASWLFGVVMYHGFGYVLSTPEMVYCDWFVIAVIMAKPEACNFRPYTGFWHQIRCIALERSKWDQRVMMLFGAAWVVYATLPRDGAAFWWSLFAIAVLQFIAAAAEPLLKWREARKAKRAEPDIPPAGHLFASPAWVTRYG